jgi:hypothetical protein
MGIPGGIETAALMSVKTGLIFIKESSLMLSY